MYYKQFSFILHQSFAFAFNCSHHSIQLFKTIYQEITMSQFPFTDVINMWLLVLKKTKPLLMPYNAQFAYLSYSKENPIPVTSDMICILASCSSPTGTYISIIHLWLHVRILAQCNPGWRCWTIWMPGHYMLTFKSISISHSHMLILIPIGLWETYSITFT